MKDHLPAPGTASRMLFDRGMADLGRRFDPDAGLVRVDGNDALHDLRDSLWHALGLLLRGDPPGPAETIIRRVLTTQVTDPADAYRGNFRWFPEVEAVFDLNAVEFMLERLAHILLRASARLSAETVQLIHDSMRLGFGEVRRLDVHWTYTNIYLLDAHNSILGGQMLGDEELVERGAERLREWLGKTLAAGAPHEFNSPTYSAVQIIALAAIAQFARDAGVRDLALEAERVLWMHVSRHFHAPTLQLAGPHSRAYRRDVTGSVGFLKVLLYKVLEEDRLLSSTPYYSGPGREGDIIVGLTDFNPPDAAVDMFRKTTDREFRETSSGGQSLTTLLSPGFALGTMSREYRVGDPPEPWPQQNSCHLVYRRDDAPGYGVLYCRYIVNERRAGDTTYASSGAAVDLWDNGLFRAAQSGSLAVVAYGSLPHGLRPVHSLKLDIRMLGPQPGPGVLIDSSPWDGAERQLGPGQSITVSDGDVHVGIIPLTAERLSPVAPILLWRDGQELVVSIYNYKGPPKSFWEYRMLGGPFYRGNLRNGFVLAAAPSDSMTAGEFASLLAEAHVDDQVEGPVRRVHCRFRSTDVSLEYDLRQLRL